MQTNISEAQSIYKECLDAYEKMPVWEKINMANNVEVARRYHSIPIWFTGYVKTKEKFAVDGGGGEHYVYLWKHIDGDIFYVGSGKKKRWTSKNGRNMRFFKEIDKGDAVVYKILQNASYEEARFYEKYLSIIIGLSGVKLTNKDNNIDIMGREKALLWVEEKIEQKDNGLTKRVENALLNGIIGDRDFGFYEAVSINGFLGKYGNDYFSRQGWREILFD